MIDPQSLPMILLISVLALLLGAVIAIAWGKRMPRLVEWWVGAGLVFPAGALAWAAHALSEEDWKPKVWLRGWVWPASGEGALTVGVLQDRLGFIISALTLLITAAVLFNRGATQTNPRRERVVGSAALGAAGVILAWLSATPWLNFIGIALTIFGGIATQLCYWDENTEAKNAALFAWERFGGLALSVFGACGLAGARPALVWGSANNDTVGTVFLILGLVSQFGLFPLNGWSIRPFRGKSWNRVVVAQVFPAWAAFAALLRLHPAFESNPLSTPIAWFLIVAGIFNLLSGLLRSELKGALSTWISSGFSLATAALFLAGGRAGFSLFMGLSLGAVSLAGICATLSERPQPLPPIKDWLRIGGRVVAFCAIAAAIGLPGFVSAGGGVQWLEVLIQGQPPALVAAVLLAIGLFAMLGWRIFFILRTFQFSESTSAVAIALPFLVLIPCLGLAASGMITGGALPGPQDEVLPSLLSAIFDSSARSAGDDTQFFAASGMLWGALLVGFVGAYWLRRKLKMDEKSGTSGFGKVYRFVAEGYRIEEAAAVGIYSFDWVGRRMSSWVDGVLWSRWIPTLLIAPFRRMGALASRLDEIISETTQQVVARVSELPSFGLQFIQNGDVQWYLIFSLGSGFLILIYFLRK